MKRVLSICIFCLSFLVGNAQQTVGIFLNDSLALNGYTLIAPSSSKTTYLIDNCGNIVNQWESDLTPGAVAYLLPNGDLLRTGRISGSFGGGGLGGRVELYDWDNTLKWAYDFASEQHHQHHDIEYLPNGNLLILMWDRLFAEDLSLIHI